MKGLIGIALAAGVCCMPPAVAAQEAGADGLMETFLAESGEDLEACFDEAVEMQEGPAGPDLAGTGDVAPSRVVVAVDASGSMAGSAGGTSKMAAAKKAVAAFLDSVPEGVEVGLLAFGHTGDNQESGKAQSCQGVETIVPVGTDRARVRSGVERLSATGWTPLASAIEMAAAELQPSDKAGEQVVYVVSDGVETCEGDPVAAARALHESEVRAVVNIIGLDLPADERAQLESVAAAGGGVFEAVSGGEALIDAMGRRARNIGEMTRVRAMSGHATRHNNAAVGGAMLRINTCVAGIVTRENRKFGRWSKDQREAGTPSELLGEVSEQLRERHGAARERAREMYDAFRAESGRANEKIRRTRDAAEETFKGR